MKNKEKKIFIFTHYLSNKLEIKIFFKKIKPKIKLNKLNIN